MTSHMSAKSGDPFARVLTNRANKWWTVLSHVSVEFQSPIVVAIDAGYGIGAFILHELQRLPRSFALLNNRG